jgi:large subunit ribosomal protein L21
LRGLHGDIQESVMYAVIKTGGKQYRVAPGQVLHVEKINAAEGDAVQLDEVLMIADGDDIRVGAPNIEGGRVEARVRSQGRRRKVEIMKFRRRKHHQKQMGHRQAYTELEITGIHG